jgi:hypothetical protein
VGESGDGGGGNSDCSQSVSCSAKKKTPMRKRNRIVAERCVLPVRCDRNRRSKTRVFLQRERLLFFFCKLSERSIPSEKTHH